MVEEQATKEVEPRLPRLLNGWLSHQSRQSLLMLSKSKTRKGETQIYSRQERSNLDTRSDQMDLRYVRCKVNGNPRSMDDVTR